MIYASSPSRQRGLVVVIVLWAIAVAAIITSSIQLFAYRQASLGREALERTQARWAARAGIENTIAVMADHTERPYPDDAKALLRDMFHVHSGSLLHSAYDIIHHVNGRDVGGPMDEHSKININLPESKALLTLLEDMSFDVIDAINDWTDDDDMINSFGVERDYYLSLEGPYLPRNGPIRTLGEMELIAGIWPKEFRGEDWNLNFRLDPNENDGNQSLPEDEADDVLDGLWSSRITPYTVDGGATASGLPRIYLKLSSEEELMDRLGIDLTQAETLITFGQEAGNEIADLIHIPLSSALDSNSGRNRATPTSTNARGAEEESPENPFEQQQVRRSTRNRGLIKSAALDLTEEQMRAVLAETTTKDPYEREPGKMNLNTVSPDLIRDIFYELELDEAIADEIIYMRDSRPEGITSLVDLKDIPGISNEDLRTISHMFDTVSSVFTICSRGRAWATGLEVEIIAVVDRSTVPVRIIEYREQ